MKNLAYARRENEPLRLFSYENHQEVKLPDSISALMMCRTDFNVKIIEIPPVDREQIPSLLNYRLKSLYPGDPENTRFDYEIFTKDKKQYAALFITSRENLEAYKALAGKKPLYLPLSMVEPLVKKEKTAKLIYFYWHEEWIDIIAFENKKLLSSTAIKREKEIFLDVLKFKNILPAGFEDYKLISLCLRKEREEVNQQSAKLFSPAEEVEFYDVEEIAAGFKKRKDSLFSRSNQKPTILSKLKAEYFLLPVLLMLMLLFEKHMATRVEFKNLLEQSQQAELRTSTVQVQYQGLKKRLKDFQKRSPLDIYRVLSEISGIMARDAILYSLKIDSEKLTFLMEGEAYNALRFIDRLNSVELFTNVLLIDNVLNQDLNKDIFKITGEINVDR